VRALARDAGKAASVLPECDRLGLVIGDVLGEGVADDLLDGCGACIHLIGIIREGGGGRTFRRMHVEATDAVVGACRDRGVGRYVHMSALGVDPEGRSEYQRTKFEGERIVRASGLDWTIFRPGLIHGPEGEFVRLAAGWVRGTETPRRFLPYFKRGRPASGVPFAATVYEDPLVAPVWVQDVADCIVEALGRRASIGEIYNVVGAETLSWPQMLVLMRDCVRGADPSLMPRGVPADLAICLARGARALGVASLLPFDEGQAAMGSLDSTAQMEKVATDLEITTAPFAQTFGAYAARL